MSRKTASQTQEQFLRWEKTASQTQEWFLRWEELSKIWRQLGMSSMKSSERADTFEDLGSVELVIDFQVFCLVLSIKINTMGTGPEQERPPFPDLRQDRKHHT